MNFGIPLLTYLEAIQDRSYRQENREIKVVDKCCRSVRHWAKTWRDYCRMVDSYLEMYL